MEDNKLIAEFMGLEALGGKHHGVWVWINADDSSLSYLVPSDWKEWGSTEIRNGEKCMYIPTLYDTSWDWLMPVIRHIIDELNYELPEDSNLIGDIMHGLVDINMNETHKAVIKFIKWYNQNK